MSASCFAKLIDPDAFEVGSGVEKLRSDFASMEMRNLEEFLLVFKWNLITIAN